MTVNEWYKYWYDTYKVPTVRPNTLRNIRERYEKNVEPYIGESLLVN